MVIRMWVRVLTTKISFNQCLNFKSGRLFAQLCGQPDLDSCGDGHQNVGLSLDHCDLHELTMYMKTSISLL